MPRRSNFVARHVAFGLPQPLGGRSRSAARRTVDQALSRGRLIQSRRWCDETRVTSAYQRVLRLENRIHHELVLHSISTLRIAVGAVFLGFGILKYFPGVSPAQNLTEATTQILFLGLIPGSVALVGIATLECFIGIALLADRWLRLAIWLLAIEFVGVLAPLVVLPGRLFSGPHNAPTLEGQYVLKDVILVAAALVIAAGSFRGGQLVRTDPPPGERRVESPPQRSAQARRAGRHTISDAARRNGPGDPRHIPGRPGLGKA
jgi:uncharacterized membrane protein YkgB